MAFRIRIQERGPDDCWPWTGGKSNFGHGRFKFRGKLYSPHRLVYAMFCGPIPKGENVVVRHSCDNPACCNPKHLLIGTRADNVRDMVVRGRIHRSDEKLDRASIMREAHRQYAQMARFGWSWSRCLSFAWAKAKARAA